MDTTKLKFPILRIIMLCYFVYKMVFANANFKWNSIFELDNSSAGTLTGEIIVKVFFAYVIVAYFIYQTRQMIAEFSKCEPQKFKFRTLSIIFSNLFFPITALSLFNISIDFNKSSLISYLLEFYTIATIIGVIAAVLVAIEDVRILLLLRK